MLQILSQIFSYPFITRALIAGTIIALCASLLGVILILKRFSMIGDGLSHVGFGTMAIAMAFNWAPLLVSIPVCILAAFLLLRVSSSSNIILKSFELNKAKCNIIFLILIPPSH